MQTNLAQLLNKSQCGWVRTLHHWLKVLSPACKLVSTVMCRAYLARHGQGTIYIEQGYRFVAFCLLTRHHGVLSGISVSAMQQET